MSQVQCWYYCCGTMLVDWCLSHRTDGGRGVGVMGGCEDTRGTNGPPEDEQHSERLYQKRAFPWEHARCAR